MWQKGWQSRYRLIQENMEAVEAAFAALVPFGSDAASAALSSGGASGMAPAAPVLGQVTPGCAYFFWIINARRVPMGLARLRLHSLRRCLLLQQQPPLVNQP